MAQKILQQLPSKFKLDKKFINDTTDDKRIVQILRRRLREYM